MAVTAKLCVLTVHGIGFQQPPTETTAGYADTLHENLHAALGARLGDDPQRRPGGYGPVYVMSAKPGTRDTEWGLGRLGSWNGGNLDIAGMPLTAGDEPVAHVALVYSSLEGVGPHLGTGMGTVGEAGMMLNHYASVAGAVRLVVGDAWAALHHRAGASGSQSASPSLRPRADLVPARRHHIATLLHRTPQDSGIAGTVLALEEDVVAYVCRNDLRERIREFIAEALRRLLARPDVAGVVVNAHSQGTVAAFDVLRLYPPDPASRVRAVVTAGSPLRKYADLFSWGNDAGGMQNVKWLNFWDTMDPVADPLDPPASWHYGDPGARGLGEAGLFSAADASGEPIPVPIEDRKVDNLTNSSGGGLQAHNYWDNTIEFIPQLAGLLKE
jgi:hypothetical protein